MTLLSSHVHSHISTTTLTCQKTQASLKQSCSLISIFEQTPEQLFSGTYDVPPRGVALATNDAPYNRNVSRVDINKDTPIGDLLHYMCTTYNHRTCTDTISFGGFVHDIEEFLALAFLSQLDGGVVV